ncbi:DUF3426 domain-containing protein [Azonexus sp.]|uniref:DUF3426 domain-containing protein n=1 Tax=Azonexus sp. TaxID=1872668 RepID=UPI0039E277B9
MSERPQNLMRSRCPECATIFRVTSEQLRLKAGKVRCGQCRAVFNAFDQLLVGSGAQDNPPTIMPMPSIAPQPIPAKPEKSTQTAPAPTPPAPAVPNIPEEPAQTAPPGDAHRLTQETFAVEMTSADAMAAAPPPAASAVPPETCTPPAELPETLAAAPIPAQLVVADAPPETLEQTLHAARAAGLVAAREVGDSPAYNRWSAAALSTGGLSDFDEPARRPLWPYLILALLFALSLLGQLAYHYRTALTLRLPALLPAYQTLGVDVPLPREASLIAIEASDLQADPARGLFVLRSTLKNRANYDQAWPQLALSLTDVNDRTLARRMINVADYLGAQHPPAFAAGSDVDVRLWIDARDIEAAGYRLYLFYPPS